MGGEARQPSSVGTATTKAIAAGPSTSTGSTLGAGSGRLPRCEGWGGAEAFEGMDRNNADYLSRTEFLNREQARDRDWDDTDRRDDRRSRELAANRDGRMSRGGR